MTKIIGLAEYILKVKQDLLNEQFLRKDDESPLFAIEEIEIELSVVATKEGGGSGKVGFKLGVPLTGEFSVEGGGEGKYSREDVQLIRVKLAPFLTREQILAEMSDKQRKEIAGKTAEYMARSGGDEATGSDRA